MKCIILAAGYATRLYPLTKNYPKPLLKIENKPILNWLIDDINTCRLIDEYIVISNHKYYNKYLSWAKLYNLPISILDDGTTSNESRLGAVRDIWFAIEKKHLVEDALVIAGDNILDFTLVPFIEFCKQENCSCVMYYEEKDTLKLHRTAVISIATDNIIKQYEEKPNIPISNLAVPPFYYYRADDLRRIPEALADGCGFDAPGSFAAWLSKKVTMKAYKMPGNRYDIGTIEDYNAVKTNHIRVL